MFWFPWNRKKWWNSVSTLSSFPDRKSSVDLIIFWPKFTSTYLLFRLRQLPFLSSYFIFIFLVVCSRRTSQSSLLNGTASSQASAAPSASTSGTSTPIGGSGRATGIEKPYEIAEKLRMAGSTPSTTGITAVTERRRASLSSTGKPKILRTKAEVSFAVGFVAIWRIFSYVVGTFLSYLKSKNINEWRNAILILMKGHHVIWWGTISKTCCPFRFCLRVIRVIMWIKY